MRAPFLSFIAFALVACGSRVTTSEVAPSSDAGPELVTPAPGCPAVPARKIGASALAMSPAKTSLAPDSPSTYCARGPSPGECPKPGDPFFGQDGNYSIRVPTYEIGADVVRDSVTGLEWQRFAPKKVVHSIDEAKAICEALNVDGGGFRLPTRVEAVTLVDYGAGPSGIAKLEPDFASSMWTSTAAPSGNPWLLLNVGNVMTIASFPGADVARFYDLAVVRCMRGGGEKGTEAVSADGDRVFDPNTGLEWQREVKDVPAMSLECALAYCANVSSDPMRPFRVPSVKELSTIADGDRDPAIDRALFPDTPQEPFLTSTLTKGTPGDIDVWGIMFRSMSETNPSTGPWVDEAGTIVPFVEWVAPSTPGGLRVRCVR